MNEYKTRDLFGPYRLWLGMLLAVVGFFFNSCDKEADTLGGRDLNITIGRTSGIIDTNLASDGEWIIYKVRVYAFDGIRLDKMVFKENITADNLGYYNLTIQDVSLYEHKKLYVIVNEPGLLKETLDAVTSPGELSNIRYLLSAYTTGTYIDNKILLHPSDFRLPMFGVKEINTNAVDNVEIPVDRAVARVDLSLTNNSGKPFQFKLSNTTIEVNNINPYGYLLPDLVMGGTVGFKRIYSGDATPFQLSAGKTVRITFYLPERACPTDAERLMIRLNNIAVGADVNQLSYEIMLSEVKDKDGNTKTVTSIDRNNLYTIKCTFSDKLPIQYEATVTPWVEENDFIVI